MSVATIIAYGAPDDIEKQRGERSQLGGGGGPARKAGPPPACTERGAELNQPTPTLRWFL